MNTLDPTAGAAAYRGALAGAGGRELDALHRGRLAVALYASPPYDMAVPAMAVSRLSINLSDSAVHGGFDGERARSYEAHRHSLFLTPAGAPAHWRKERPSRHLNLYFDAAALRDDDELRWSAPPLFNARLPQATQLIDQLASEMSGSDPFAAEAVDCLARLLLVTLARRPPAAGALDARALARVDEFIAAHLGRRLLVSELAAAAGLPPARFAIDFAARTGATPHQYVLARRVERARSLLARGAAPLAEVAADCGFSSQQHMTLVLQRRLGTTPARLRRAAQ